MLILCLLTVGNMQSVRAASSSGTKSPVTVLGQKYNYYSQIMIDSEGFMCAITIAETADKVNKPIGYMGMLARLF